MDPKDLERWAAKMARKGVRGAVGQAPAPAPQPAAPPRHQEPERWGAPVSDAPRPMRQAPPGTVWSPRAPESNTLVRPGPSMWDTMLQNVPDLAPDLSGGYDSMEGRTSPMSAALLREAGAFDDVPRSYNPNAAPAGAPAPLKDLPPAPGSAQLALPGTGGGSN